MNDNELTKIADLICSIFFNKENTTKTNKEMIELIKPIIMKVGSEERVIGRLQVINHIETTCKDLRGML
ncbi:MAG: hypothetical protein PHF86_03310 [Candidatus Nanoarchaeia archaeon]|jgi:hypothetical protein|nr:hypothetical protein [Candidatus Nanoarchaeia archaeon]